MRYLAPIVLCCWFFPASFLLAQPANITARQVRPKEPLYERELLQHNLAIDLAFRTTAGPPVTFRRGELLVHVRSARGHTFREIRNG